MVPPSVVLGGIYAFNDKCHLWFDPSCWTESWWNHNCKNSKEVTQGNRDDLNVVLIQLKHSQDKV